MINFKVKGNEIEVYCGAEFLCILPQDSELVEGLNKARMGLSVGDSDMITEIEKGLFGYDTFKQAKLLRSGYSRHMGVKIGEKLLIDLESKTVTFQKAKVDLDVARYTNVFSQFNKKTGEWDIVKGKVIDGVCGVKGGKSAL
jgi:hypothetical protein